MSKLVTNAHPVVGGGKAGGGYAYLRRNDCRVNGRGFEDR